MHDNKKLRVILSGGGTLGPVMPLIALGEELRRRHKTDLSLLWVGTYRGIERAVVRAHKMEFTAIPAAKFRRYFSIKTFFEPLVFFAGFIKSFIIILTFKPDVLVSAGGFVSVPLHLIAFLLGIPTVIHQQDIEIGLANRIMRWSAKRITVTFEKSVAFFSKNKVVWTGNPVRRELLQGNKDRGMVRFHLDTQFPTVLVFGGGTGAVSLNIILAECLGSVLGHSQVIHLTGQGKGVMAPLIREANRNELLSKYHPYEFLMDEEMGDAYAVADIVVSRAGLSSLSEISALGKASVIVPIPCSHQELNARFFVEKQAGVIVEEAQGSRGLSATIIKLLNDHTERLHLQQHSKRLNKITAANEMADVVEGVAEKK